MEYALVLLLLGLAETASNANGQKVHVALDNGGIVDLTSHIENQNRLGKEAELKAKKNISVTIQPSQTIDADIKMDRVATELVKNSKAKAKSAKNTDIFQRTDLSSNDTHPLLLNKLPKIFNNITTVNGERLAKSNNHKIIKTANSYQEEKNITRERQKKNLKKQSKIKNNMIHHTLGLVKDSKVPKTNNISKKKIHSELNTNQETLPRPLLRRRYNHKSEHGYYYSQHQSSEKQISKTGKTKSHVKGYGYKLNIIENNGKKPKFSGVMSVRHDNKTVKKLFRGKVPKKFPVPIRQNPLRTMHGFQDPFITNKINHLSKNVWDKIHNRHPPKTYWNRRIRPFFIRPIGQRPLRWYQQELKREKLREQQRKALITRLLRQYENTKRFYLPKVRGKRSLILNNHNPHIVLNRRNFKPINLRIVHLKKSRYPFPYFPDYFGRLKRNRKIAPKVGFASGIKDIEQSTKRHDKTSLKGLRAFVVRLPIRSKWQFKKQLGSMNIKKIRAEEQPIHKGQLLPNPPIALFHARFQRLPKTNMSHSYFPRNRMGMFLHGQKIALKPNKLTILKTESGSFQLPPLLNILTKVVEHFINRVHNNILNDRRKTITKTFTGKPESKLYTDKIAPNNSIFRSEDLANETTESAQVAKNSTKYNFNISYHTTKDIIPDIPSLILPNDKIKYASENETHSREIRDAHGPLRNVVSRNRYRRAPNVTEKAKEKPVAAAKPVQKANTTARPAVKTNMTVHGVPLGWHGSNLSLSTILCISAGVVIVCCGLAALITCLCLWRFPSLGFGVTNKPGLSSASEERMKLIGPVGSCYHARLDGIDTRPTISMGDLAQQVEAVRIHHEKAAGDRGPCEPCIPYRCDNEPREPPYVIRADQISNPDKDVHAIQHNMHADRENYETFADYSGMSRRVMQAQTQMGHMQVAQQGGMPGSQQHHLSPHMRPPSTSPTPQRSREMPSVRQ